MTALSAGNPLPPPCLGILLQSPSYRRPAALLAEAAQRRGYRIRVFLSGDAAGLAEYPEFRKLHCCDGLRICRESRETRGLFPEPLPETAAAFRSRPALSREFQTCDRCLVL